MIKPNPIPWWGESGSYDLQRILGGKLFPVLRWVVSMCWDGKQMWPNRRRKNGRQEEFTAELGLRVLFTVQNKESDKNKKWLQVVTWEKVINAEKHSQHQPHVEILIDCFSTQEEKTELYGLLGNHFSKEYLYKSICSNTYIYTQVMTCCKMVCSLMLRLGLSAAWWINQNTARSWISLSKVPKRKEESYKGLRCTLQPGEIQWADVSSVKISIS